MGLSSQPFFNSGINNISYEMVKEQSAIVELLMEAEVAKHERDVRVARGVAQSNTTFSSSSIIRAVLYLK